MAIMASQMAKTDTIANVIGHRLQDDPVPVLYIAPTRNFVEKTWEPRFRAMVRSVQALWANMVKGKLESKTRKLVNGVSARFAWAGSATELAGDPAGLVFLDEIDRMEDSVGGEGDPKELADSRRATYADGKTIVTSTPTEGTVETYRDPESGLDHWKPSDQVTSKVWKLWQEGTRHEFAWPCPSCTQYFVPRFQLLWWPGREDAEGIRHSCTPYEALEQARLACPHCGDLITEDHKPWMLERGRFVAPGQKIDSEGVVTGDAPQSLTVSYWVSGLCSPWRTWGQRAYAWLAAVRSGNPEDIQAVINTGFGELYTVKGEAPEPSVVERLRQPYRFGEHIDQAHRITAGVDVQKDRLVYEVRAWGMDMESWQTEHGEVWGATDEDEVWDQLALMLDRYWSGLQIDRMFVDSGYRTSRVYAFARRYPARVFPTKGHDTMEKPLKKSGVDVTPGGKVARGGLHLWHVNSDYFKRWVHERIERDPELPGGWHLSEDTDEDYCKQLVAEARIVKPSGRVVWVKIRQENHYLDCAALNVAAAHSLQLQQLTSDGPDPGGAGEDDEARPFGGERRDEGVDPFGIGDDTGGEPFSGWLRDD